MTEHHSDTDEIARAKPITNGRITNGHLGSLSEETAGTIVSPKESNPAPTTDVSIKSEAAKRFSEERPMLSNGGRKPDRFDEPLPERRVSPRPINVKSDEVCANVGNGDMIPNGKQSIPEIPERSLAQKARDKEQGTSDVSKMMDDAKTGDERSTKAENTDKFFETMPGDRKGGSLEVGTNSGLSTSCKALVSSPPEQNDARNKDHKGPAEKVGPETKTSRDLGTASLHGKVSDTAPLGRERHAPECPDDTKSAMQSVHQDATVLRNDVAPIPEKTRTALEVQETVHLDKQRDPGSKDAGHCDRAKAQTALDKSLNLELHSTAEFAREGQSTLGQASEHPEEDNSTECGAPAHQPLVSRASVPLPALRRHEVVTRASSMPPSGGGAFDERAELTADSPSYPKAAKVKKSRSLSRRMSNLFRRKDRKKARPESGAAEPGGAEDVTDQENEKEKLSHTARQTDSRDNEALPHPRDKLSHYADAGATSEPANKKREKGVAAGSDPTDPGREVKPKRKGRLFAFVRRK